jgi:hypothetical protein
MSRKKHTQRDLKGKSPPRRVGVKGKYLTRVPTPVGALNTKNAPRRHVFFVFGGVGALERHGLE